MGNVTIQEHSWNTTVWKLKGFTRKSYQISEPGTAAARINGQCNNFSQMVFTNIGTFAKVFPARDTIKQLVTMGNETIQENIFAHIIFQCKNETLREPLRRFRISKKYPTERNWEKISDWEELIKVWRRNWLVLDRRTSRFLNVSITDTSQSQSQRRVTRQDHICDCENQPRYLREPNQNIWRNLLSQGSLFSRTSRWPWCWSDYDERLTVHWPFSLRKWLKPFLQCTVSPQWGFSESTVGAIWSISFPILHNHLRRTRWPNKEATKVGHFFGV